MFLSVLNVLIYALIVIISIILVILILVQPSKGGGLGSAFGGAGENVFGAHAMEHLSKLTVWLIAIFFALTLALTALSASKISGAKSLTDNLQTEAAAPAPEAPAPEAPAPEAPAPAPAPAPDTSAAK